MSSALLLWKQEPASPLSECDETALLDATIYNATPFDIKYDVDTDLGAIASFESKAEVASHLLENLENLMDLDELIKDEPFLLDEKMLPLLDDVEPPKAIPVPVQHLKTEYVPNDTQYLLKELENVYSVVELVHGTLTPPQSPPSQQQQPMLTNLEPLLQYSATVPDSKTVYAEPAKQFITEGYSLNEHAYPPVNTPQPDIAHELAVVDELIRTRVEDMQWSRSACSSPRSSGSCSPRSPGSSSCSNFGDCSSDDPEWVPETIEEYNENIPSKPSRKRSRPYSKNVHEDKKVRKKEQNKNAATRYRMKKKAEIEVVLSTEKALQDKNTELGSKITDLHREIKYLKGLMRDLFKAKGLIN